MGFLVDNEDDALMWRGLMLNRAVQHFLEDVVWGQDLDYLLIDMPPGTGDVQMGLARMLPQAEMLIVTTPALAAQKVAARAATMARKSYLRICGIVENMSAFVTPSGEVFELFGSGGGQALADDVGTPLLARIPLEAAVSAGGDAGEPIALVGSGPAADSVPSARRTDRHRSRPARRHGRMLSPAAVRLRRRPRRRRPSAADRSGDPRPQGRSCSGGASAAGRGRAGGSSSMVMTSSSGAAAPRPKRPKPKLRRAEPATNMAAFAR